MKDPRAFFLHTCAIDSLSRSLLPFRYPAWERGKPDLLQQTGDLQIDFLVDLLRFRRTWIRSFESHVRILFNCDGVNTSQVGTEVYQPGGTEYTMQLSLSSDLLDPDGDRRFVLHEFGDL